jgi:hypothetical protein
MASTRSWHDESASAEKIRLASAADTTPTTSESSRMPFFNLRSRLAKLESDLAPRTGLAGLAERMRIRRAAGVLPPPQPRTVEQLEQRLATLPSKGMAWKMTSNLLRRMKGEIPNG